MRVSNIRLRQLPECQELSAQLGDQTLWYRFPLDCAVSTRGDAAIAEMEHIARIGLKGVQFISYPSGKGYPTPEDDRFWQAAVEMKMPLQRHCCIGRLVR